MTFCQWRSVVGVVTWSPYLDCGVFWGLIWNEVASSLQLRILPRVPQIDSLLLNLPTVALMPQKMNGNSVSSEMSISGGPQLAPKCHL